MTTQPGENGVDKDDEKSQAVCDEEGAEEAATEALKTLKELPNSTPSQASTNLTSSQSHDRQ
jgi:hypothetical protein